MGICYCHVVKFLHTLPFGLFLFTNQSVAFLHALTAKPSISALSFAVLPVTYRIHRFFFSQLFFRLIQLVNVRIYGSKSISPFQPVTDTVQMYNKKGSTVYVPFNLQCGYLPVIYNP